MTPSRPPGRPRSAEADEAILRATLELLARCGYDRTTIEAVAAEAAVARATVYRRYPTKPELVSAAIGCLRDQTCREDMGDTRAYLVASLAALRRGVETHDGVSILGSLLSMRRASPEMLDGFRERVLTPCRTRLLTALRTGVVRGEVRADADLETIATLLIGAYFSQVIAGVETDDDWAERVASALWPSLAADERRG
jgi:AcrR family transcriptional regulator